MKAFLTDLRFGLRGLRRHPGFAALAILTLALGIGATTAIFSVVDSILFQPLPYRDPDRLVTVLHEGRHPVAPGHYLDWRARSRSFAHAAAAQAWGATLSGRGRPETITPALQVTADLFAVLGVKPALGRIFAAGEDQPGAHPTVVLSHRLWAERFGGDRRIVGQSLTLDGKSYTVIGVMPRGFSFAPFWIRNAALWTPLDLSGRREDRTGESLRVFARLGPGVTRPQAQAETTALWRRLEAEHPGTTRANVVVGSLHEKVVGEVRRPLLILLGGVTLVLLIACANVTNLLLVRSAARRKEMGIRLSLGAGRGRLFRQLLTESAAVGLTGSGLGVLLAYLGVDVLRALGPRDLPRFEAIALDARILVFALALGLLAALGSAAGPAWRLSADAGKGVLLGGSRGATEPPRRTRLRGVLVGGQVALALVLLIGAGLLLRSFWHLRRVDPGFDPQGVLAVTVPLPDGREANPFVEKDPAARAARDERRRTLATRAIARLGALPGVKVASGINHLPIGGDIWALSFEVEGAPAAPPGQEPRAVFRVVAPDYVRAMGLTLVAGRDIARRDTHNAPGVVLVNQSFARMVWPGESALGKRIRVLSDGPNPRTVVGVVKDAKQRQWTATPEPEMYLAYLQNPASTLTLVLKTTGDPRALSSAVKGALAEVDPRLPVPRIDAMEEVIAEALGQPRFHLFLLNLFAGLALLLAAVGIYGVVAFAVSRRTQEIGIRVALGAPRRRVLGLVVGQAMGLVLGGMGIGLLGALLGTRLLQSLLFEVSATDPLTFLLLPLVLAAVALVASYLPARRATRIDPMVALRAE